MRYLRQNKLYFSDLVVAKNRSMSLTLLIKLAIIQLVISKVWSCNYKAPQSTTCWPVSHYLGNLIVREIICDYQTTFEKAVSLYLAIIYHLSQTTPEYCGFPTKLCLTRNRSETKIFFRYRQYYALGKFYCMSMDLQGLENLFQSGRFQI